MFHHYNVAICQQKINPAPALAGTRGIDETLARRLIYRATQTRKLFAIRG
jgi:hypothetical protein